MQRFLILLETIDNKWKDHLHAMEVLKHGIGLRSYAQMDPKNEYKKEGYEKFELLKSAIADQVTDLAFKVELQAPEIEQPSYVAPPDMPDDPATQQAMLEAMVAAGQAPPEVMEALAAGASLEVRSQDEIQAEERAEAERAAAVRAATAGKKPKRNDPCPCGSGVKYKKCCHPAFD